MITRDNDLVTAQQALGYLLAERDETTAATVAQMDQAALLDAIYYNWRVEMWGEGRGLMTMKRFKKTVTRGSNDASPNKNMSISYTDDRLYFQVPQNELNNNPNYKE